MSRPTITVIMPAYNCGSYIGRAIDSILEQTFTDFELVICDDGSTDETWNVIDVCTDKRVRKFRHEVNKGYLVTYNHLLSLATGSLITCQDADDWSDKRRLELQEEILRKFPDVGLCAVNGVFYYSELLQRASEPFEDGYLRITEKDFGFLLASIMYRREVLEKVGGFNVYFDRLTSMDQYFVMDILSNFKGYAINRYLYFARFNPTSNHRTLDYNRKLTAHEAFRFLKKQRLATGSDWLMEKRQNDLLEFEKGLLKNRKFMAEKYREYAVYRIDSGKPLSSLPLLLKSWWLRPLYATTYRTIFYGFRQALTGK